MICLAGMGNQQLERLTGFHLLVKCCVFPSCLLLSFTSVVQTTHPQPRGFHKQGGDAGKRPHTDCTKSETPDPVCCTKAFSNHLLLPVCIFEEWKVHISPLGVNSACGSLADKTWGMGRRQHSHMHVIQLNSSLLFPKTHLVGTPLRQLSVSPKQKQYHSWSLTVSPINVCGSWAAGKWPPPSVANGVLLRCC